MCTKTLNNLFAVVAFSLCLNIGTLHAQWTSPLTVTSQTSPQDDVLIGGNSINGMGIKSFWQYQQAALRGGELIIYPNAWDSDSLGKASFAYGEDVSATGDRGSISLGVRTRASGLDGSIALGYSAMSSGQYGCISIGNNTEATGNNGATAIGFNTKATGLLGSTALGAFTTASGSNGATALGRYTEASGTASICIGSGSGIFSYLENDIDHSLMIGCNSTQPSLFVAAGNQTTAGFVGIGTTNPTQSLHVNGAIRIGNAITLEPGLILWNGTNFQGWTGTTLKNLDEAGVWNENANVASYNGNVGIGPGTNNTTHQLHVAGDIAVSGFILYPSDRHLKLNIEPIQNALTQIKKLQAHRYEHKPEAIHAFGLSNKQQYGLIAQDVKKVFPNLVMEETLVDESGQSYLGINYNMLIPILLEALKDVDEKTETLTEEIKRQEDLIKRLETLVHLQSQQIDQLLK